METNVQPYALAKEEGSAIWFLGSPTTVKRRFPRTEIN